MNWYKLWQDFLTGDPGAIQAIFAVLSFAATVVGIIFVVVTFRQQRDINQEQQEMNRLSKEKDRGELFPYFTASLEKEFDEVNNTFQVDLYLKDNNALDIELIPVNEDGVIMKPKYWPSQLATPSITPYDTWRF